MTQAVPLSLQNLTSPATALQYFNKEMFVGSRLGLPTTAFQQGAPERVIFATMANVDADSDVNASIIAQAGFIDFAATGYVTYIDATGATQTEYVTPDPSIPAQNPTGALGWLDILADGVYDVQRILLTTAGGSAALLNTTVGTTYGPFAPGAYTLGQPGAAGSPTYGNTASLTIPPSPLVGAVTGAASDTGVIQVTITAHGLVSGATVFLTGIIGTTEANGAWIVKVVDVNHIDLVGSIFVNAWTAGGTQAAYTPTVATFAASVGGSASTAVAANLVNLSVTSLIGIQCGNLAPWIGTDVEGNLSVAQRCSLRLQAIATGGPKGAYLYCALTASLLAPLLSPPLTLSTPITRALVTLDVMTGIVTVTVANAGGVVSGPSNTLGTDCAAVLAVILANCVLFGSKGAVQSATANPVTVAVKAFLPLAYNTTASATAIATAIALFFQSIPIGGIIDPGGSAPSTNVISYDSFVSAITAALVVIGVPVRSLDVQASLSGVAANYQLGFFDVATYGTPNITLVTNS